MAIEEVFSPGDAVSKEDPLISLESEKAVMDIPAPFNGTIKGCRLSKGNTGRPNRLVHNRKYPMPIGSLTTRKRQYFS